MSVTFRGTKLNELGLLDTSAIQFVLSKRFQRRQMENLEKQTATTDDRECYDFQYERTQLHNDKSPSFCLARQINQEISKENRHQHSKNYILCKINQSIDGTSNR